MSEVGGKKVVLRKEETCTVDNMDHFMILFVKYDMKLIILFM